MTTTLIRSLMTALGVLALSACSVLPKGAPNFSLHDFGPLEPAGSRTLAFPIRNLEVVPAPWLASTAMQYRLASTQETRRQAFVQSRWAAQPGQLLEVSMKRSVRANVTSVTVTGCRLRVDLDEFLQVFDSESGSRGVIEARAALLTPRTDQLLAAKSFSVSHPAPSADAVGGVVALRQGVLQLNDELIAWLDALALSGVGARCGN